MSGRSIPVVGKTEVTFKELGTLPVIVVEGILHECIIGDDALTLGKAVLDYECRTLKWKKTTVHTHAYLHPKYLCTVHPTVDAAGTAVSMGLDCRSIPPEYLEVIEEFSDVFYTDGKLFGQCPLTEVEIDTGDHPPIKQRPYRTPLSKRKMIDECIDQMLKDGVIYPSNSPWALPVCLVPKKDGTTRFCVDYRALNEITVKDRYPLPLIQDIFDQLGGKRIYSVMDLKSGYNQLRIAAHDQYKTASIVANSTMHWPHSVWQICHPYFRELWKWHCQIYWDGVYGYS